MGSGERDRTPSPSQDGGRARRWFEAGRAKWSHLRLEFDTFEPYFARHAAQALPAEAHAADMYLACAAAHGVDGALEALDGVLSNDVARAVATVDPSHDFVAEILQATRERLLVAKSGQCGKIGDYGGRASLRSWLGAVAVRLAISRRRRKGEQRHEAFDEADDRRLAKGGPEFEYLRRRYKGAFEDAVRHSLESLPPKQRMLLRLNVVEGMSIDAIAAAYQVGRSTAARWLAAARSALFDGARCEIRARLNVTMTELDSLVADMRSEIDVSILRLLSAPAGTKRAE
jgi:RNA polymerase sigma-70 factor (ECF subfamily)